MAEGDWRPEREYHAAYSSGGSGYSRPWADRGYTPPTVSGETKTAAASSPKAARTAAAPLPEFQKGEMVRHKAFGKGMILTITKMGGDALVEVAFDNVGTKKLMLKSAAQYMEKL